MALLSIQIVIQMALKWPFFSQKFTNLPSGFGALLQAPACGRKQKTFLTKQFLFAHLIVICV